MVVDGVASGERCGVVMHAKGVVVEGIDATKSICIHAHVFRARNMRLTARACEAYLTHLVLIATFLSGR